MKVLKSFDKNEVAVKQHTDHEVSDCLFRCLVRDMKDPTEGQRTEFFVYILKYGLFGKSSQRQQHSTDERRKTHRVREMNLLLEKNGLLNPIFVDWIASRRVDPGHHNAKTLKDLSYFIMRRGTVTDRSVS